MRLVLPNPTPVPSLRTPTIESTSNLRNSLWRRIARLLGDRSRDTYQ